jgi:uncharacterized protein (TIGR00106 family)
VKAGTGEYDRIRKGEERKVEKMKDFVVAEIKILPLGTGSPGVSHLVADCVSLLKNAPDIRYQVTPMATVVEGSLDRILEIVARMHELPFTKGVQRVVTSLTVDDRRDTSITMDSKVTAVETKLNGR